MEQPATCPGREGDPAVRFLPILLAAAPLVVLSGHVDFARLPQQVFVQLSALALGLAWVAGGARGTGSSRRRALDGPLLACLAWPAVSLLLTADRGVGLRTLGHWAACALVYVVVSRAANSADVPRLSAGLLLGGVLAAAVGLGQALLGLGFVPQAAAPAATLANRDVAGGYMVALVPLALVAWPCRAARIAAACAAGTMLAFLPFTRARAAAVAVALQLVVLTMLHARSTRRPRWAAGASLLAASLVLGVAAWATLADPAKARSTSVRWGLARSALSMALERPLLGVGLGRFGVQCPSHGSLLRSDRGTPLRVESPHNEGLQILAETGVPGLLAGLWAAAAALGTVRRLRQSAAPGVRHAALALGLCLAGLAVDAAFGFPLRSAVPPLVLAVLLGLLAALDVGGSPASRWHPLCARPLRLAVVAGLAVALVLTASASLARLEYDRSLYEAALLPIARPEPEPARSASCGAGVTLERRADGRVNLLAHAVPLTEVLSCLVEQVGLRLEYDGPPPQQMVSVAIRGESLVGAIESLFEGLGVNYMLGLDPSGAGVGQLIVSGASQVSAPVGSSPQSFGTPEGTPRSGSQPYPASPSSEAPDRALPVPSGEPGENRLPVEPEEVTPVTLQFIPRHDSMGRR